MADDVSVDGEEDLWASAAKDLEEQRKMLRDNAAESQEEEATGDSVAVAPQAGEDMPPPGKMEMILDIPLHLNVELGRTKMLINDLLQLGQGSVIELTKLVGEPLDVLVNERLVAKGEVVVVNEKFGVRLTEVLSPKDRIETLS